MNSSLLIVTIEAQRCMVHFNRLRSSSAAHYAMLSIAVCRIAPLHERLSLPLGFLSSTITVLVTAER